MTDRQCRFAGSFFPACEDALAAEVDAHLSEARRAGLTGAANPRAIVAAHAGYRYSGRFAALGYAAVTAAPSRVVVLSPSHRHAFRGIAFPSQDRFLTPIGPVGIDRDACAALEEAELAHEDDAAHDNEHGIETQLPFLRRLWPGARLVPLVCGDVPVAQVAQAIDALAAEKGTLVVLSSDLSHFLTHDAARAKDSETAQAIETGTEAAITPYHACGASGIRGWLTSRAGQGARALRLGMGDSSDVTGDTGRVVGYGAWAFYPADAPMLNARARAALLHTARKALATRLAAAPPAATPATAALLTRAASFVTLTHRDRLRGCVGSLTPHRALVADVAGNAVKAATADPRFAPVPASLLPDLAVKIAVLSLPARLDFTSECAALAALRPGEDGLILSSAGRRGTFLPMVWESLTTPKAFLDGLKVKAGLPRDHWAGDLTLHRFRVESFAQDAAA